MQIRRSHKSKQFFSFGFRFLIPVLALLSIGYQLNNLDTDVSMALESISRSQGYQFFFMMMVILGFTTLNWLIEAFRWKLSVNRVSKISVSESLRQCLAGASASVLTPAKMGDYAVKPLFYGVHLRLQIVWLNTFNHLLQMLATSIFGIPAILLLLMEFPQVTQFIEADQWWVAPGALMLVVFIVTPIIKTKMKPFYLQLIRLKRVTTINLGIQVFSLAVWRYLVFNTQFILLLMLLGSHLSFIWSFVVSASIYLLNSVLPTPAVSDGLVKGGLGVLLFGMFDVNPWIVLVATLIMWLANHVLPALVGSYLLMQRKDLKPFN